MAIKKTTKKKATKKKVSKKKSTRKAVLSIERAIEIVSSQASISAACKSAVVDYNAAARSVTAANKKVIAFTGRFEKSQDNVAKAKTSKQKELAKKRLVASRLAKNTAVADARAKTKALNTAERILRALAKLYSASYEKFKKEFIRNAAAKAKALTPKTKRPPTKRGIRLKKM